jgi:hypothetical protein
VEINLRMILILMLASGRFGAPKGIERFLVRFGLAASKISIFRSTRRHLRDETRGYGGVTIRDIATGLPKRLTGFSRQSFHGERKSLLRVAG